MKKKILFLDDDKYEMYGLLDRLEHEGFEVTYCIYPQEAKKLLTEGFKPDLIVSDLIMSNNVIKKVEEKYHAGVNFCKFVRDDVDLNCPIIVLTVVTEPSIIESVKQHNVLLLNKPISARYFVSRVKEKIRKGVNEECINC